MARLVLLPGLAADERMYAALGDPGAELVTPRLPPPLSGEAMPAYARRVAKRLAVDRQDLLGGCSFGSLVAVELARQQPVRGLLLVAGALSSASVSPFAHLLGQLPLLLPTSTLRRIFASDLNLKLFFGAKGRPYFGLVRQMLADTDDDLLRYGARLAVGYRPDAPPACPVAAIHGGADRIMAPPPVADCTVVEGAGHGLALSHPQEVTQLLRKAVKRMLKEESV